MSRPSANIPIPSQTAAFIAWVEGTLVPGQNLGVAVQGITVQSRPGAVLFVEGLADPDAVVTRVMLPLSRGLPDQTPAHLAAAGLFPAPAVRVAQWSGELLAGVLSGMTAIHLDGSPAALLVDTRAANPTQNRELSPDLTQNIARIRRMAGTPDLAVKPLASTPAGAGGALLYLRGGPGEVLVPKVERWALGKEASGKPTAWWQPAADTLRLPASERSRIPAALVDSLRRGYLVLLTDEQDTAQIVPASLDLFLSAPQDEGARPVIQRLLTAIRTGAAIAVLLLPGLVAGIATYHRDMIPNPIFTAIMPSRQKMPLAVAFEVLLLEVAADILRSAGERAGFRGGRVLAVMVAVLVGYLMLFAGFVSNLPVLGLIGGVAAELLLSSGALSRALRLWRYLFVGASAGIGFYGMSLLLVALGVYLGEESFFGHPLRLSPRARKELTQ